MAEDDQVHVAIETPGQAGLPRLLDVEQLVGELGRDRRWIYRAVEEHGLPAIKIGRKLLFDLDAVLGWLRAHQVGEWPSAPLNGDGAEP